MRHRMLLLAGLASLATVLGMTLAAPAANAAGSRQTFGELFYGSPSVTVPECESAGTADENAGRFDFYRCVPDNIGSTQAEELEGFVITG
jgi:hypothetical protein